MIAVSAAALAATPADSVRSGELEQAWFRLTQELETHDQQGLSTRVAELMSLAERVSLERLTPFALALTARSRALPRADAESLLVVATTLDPGCTEAHLELAAIRLRRWALLAGGASALRAAEALFADGRLSQLMLGSAAIALASTLAAAFGLWSLLAIRRVLPALWHDLMEMGNHWRLGPNGVVVGFVALALPLFAGGDVVWLALWLLALCWAYASRFERLTMAAGVLLVAAAPTIVEVGFRAATRSSNGIIQATTALAERRYDPQVLDELDAVGDLFSGSPDYYLLTGDVYRQYGLLDGAAWAYREGLRLAPNSGPLSLALGTVRYLEGDYNAALQAFQSARTAGADPVVVNYDLSLTFAQTYHFHESDEAMERARSLGQARLRHVTRGHDHQPILPVFSSRDAQALLASVDPVSLMHRGLEQTPLLQERTVAHPLTFAALTALVFAMGHLLLRERTTGFARVCLRCGRSFCHRCRLSQERQSYCAQCVNIFLKKDTVGIESQMAKRRQVARHQLTLKVERRVGDLLLPGLGLGFAGRPVLGAIIGMVAVPCIAASTLWLPLFVSPALMYSPVWPVQALGAVGWLLAMATAAAIPADGR
jgi:hypothetical protein